MNVVLFCGGLGTGIRDYDHDLRLRSPAARCAGRGAATSANAPALALGRPNFFVPLSEAQVARKLEIALDAFASQQTRRWFDEDTFHALLRPRGVECNAGYAEAFHARKLVLAPSAAPEARWRA